MNRVLFCLYFLYTNILWCLNNPTRYGTLKVELKVGILRLSSAFILGFFLNLILYPKEIISDENRRKSYNIGDIVTQLSITVWES